MAGRIGGQKVRAKARYPRERLGADPCKLCYRRHVTGTDFRDRLS